MAKCKKRTRVFAVCIENALMDEVMDELNAEAIGGGGGTTDWEITVKLTERQLIDRIAKKAAAIIRRQLLADEVLDDPQV